MKKRIYSLFLLLILFALCHVSVFAAGNSSVQSIAIDAAHFPDAVFRSYVSEHFDLNGDGYLSQNEILSAAEIDLSNSNLASLKGIEYFTSLDNLACSETSLTSLDLSGNSALKKLSCSTAALSSLDVSCCPSLEFLMVDENPLTELKIGRNSSLTKLWCDRSKLTNLDVTGCSALELLSLSETSISSLDLSGNPYLLLLDCRNTGISELDLRSNQTLSYTYQHGDYLTDPDFQLYAVLSESGYVVFWEENWDAASSAFYIDYGVTVLASNASAPAPTPSPTPSPTPTPTIIPGSENAPSSDAPLSKENILALLDVYDPDGAYIIRNSDDSILLEWFDSNTMGDAVEDMNTAVHEQCHIFTTKNGFRYNATTGKYTPIDERIYIGGENSVFVPFTEVYDSREMVASIPDSLRTSRFNTYINTDNETTSSRQHGIYGILNEFAAYCWGTNTSLRLVPYAEQNGLSDMTRSNVYVAYAEFRYYTLQYLLYARDFYPEIYDGIINNSTYVSVVRTIENTYQGFAEKWRSSSSSLFYQFENEYLALMNEMVKPDYVELANFLFGSGPAPSTPTTLILPGSLTTISSEAFANVSARKIVIPASVTTINSKAFANCGNLQILYFEGSPKTIAADILSGCSGVTVSCPAGSSAATWANSQGLTVELR